MLSFFYHSLLPPLLTSFTLHPTMPLQRNPRPRHATPSHSPLTATLSCQITTYQTPLFLTLHHIHSPLANTTRESIFIHPNTNVHD
ncbi:hypothetical protein E2C01_096792 [Portunus trituberculatus]|uniref:Uncharacterized protein n=1 Tax=Portunus trituberculatus TaxID=210409 RepID=A0A5B7JYS8_PORTR|nr:hypothetical protein [Portunus trituberculatus]